MVFVSISVGVDRQFPEAQGIHSIWLYYHFSDKFALFASSVKHNAEKWFLRIPGIHNLQIHPTLTVVQQVVSIMKHTFRQCFSAVQVNHGENCC